ncbi:unnamed protein product, partial [Ectocarpus sp. 8 AP-2014]
VSSQCSQQSNHPDPARPLQDHNATATPVLECVGCLGRGTLEKLCTALPYGCDDERDALD